jgi:hypothetical protein
MRWQGHAPGSACARLRLEFQWLSGQAPPIDAETLRVAMLTGDRVPMVPMRGTAPVFPEAASKRYTITKWNMSFDQDTRLFRVVVVGVEA